MIVVVPEALPRDSTVQYEVVPSGGMQFLGPLTGEVTPRSSGERVVVLTVRVPAHTPAGRQVAGHVLFSVTGTPRADVPCAIEIPRVRDASLLLVRRLFAARTGDRITLRYLLTNTGNAPDTLELRLRAPAGWEGGRGTVRHVLAGGGAADGAVTVAIPRGAATGSARLEFVASNASGEVTRAGAAVEVVDGVTRRTADLPRLTTSVATVLGDTTPATPVFGFELEGKVADGVRAYGRLVEAVDPDRINVRGLSRVGLFPGTSFLALTGPRWRFTAGSASQTFSDVTGVNLWGRGAAFTYDGPRWNVATLLARPIRFGTPAGGQAGHFIGAQVGRQVGGGSLRGTVTSADDPQSARQLTAVGFGATSPPVLGGVRLSAEVAQRRFATGQGFGWLAEAKHQGQGRYLFVRYAHAPGGSAAFAPARDLLTASLASRLTRAVNVGGGVWATSDTSPTFRRLRSSGWSLGPQVAVSERTTVELELRGNQFDASGGSGAIGSSETVARLGVISHLGVLFGTGSVAAGRSTRSAALPGGTTSEASAGRFLLRGTLGWTAAPGVFEASASYEQNGAGIGLLPRQYVVGLRASAVPVPLGHLGATGSASVQHYGWFGARAGATILRAGVHVPLPAEFVLTLDAERNPLFLAPGGGPRWNTAVKLEHSMALPLGALRAAAHGRVYEDLNANGQRDPGEPGLAGALVRRGGEAVVTDADGRFRFATRADGTPRLDETSLPFGLVANTGAPVPQGRGVEISVIPTAPVTVRLVATGDSTQPAPRAPLSGARVYARDQAGDLWSARPDSAGVATFHALPPGRYRVEVDLSGLKTPLILHGALPEFTVEAGRETPAITVPVFPRPVRMFDANNPGRNRSQGGRQ